MGIIKLSKVCFIFKLLFKLRWMYVTYIKYVLITELIRAGQNAIMNLWK